MKMAVFCVLAMLVSSVAVAEDQPERPTYRECERALKAYKTGKRNPTKWSVSKCVFHGVLTFEDLQ